jgi:hypothetical protein
MVLPSDATHRPETALARLLTMRGAGYSAAGIKSRRKQQP